MTRGRAVALLRALAGALLCASCGFLAFPALAHEIRPAVVTVTFAPPAYTIDISGNVEAMLAGVGPNVADTSDSPNAKRYDALRQDPPETLKARIREFSPDLVRGLGVEFDGRRAMPELVGADVPDVGDIKLARISVLHLRGTIPAGAKDFRWSMSR